MYMSEIYLIVMMMIDVVTSQALLSDIQNACYGGVKDMTAKRRYSDYEKMVLEQRFEIMTHNYNSLKLRVENLEKNDLTIWQPWGSYSACSQTCVSSRSNLLGSRTRQRQCAYRAVSQSQKTPICHGGAPSETVPCTASKLCPEDQAVIDTSKYIGGSGGSTFDDRSVKNGKPITAIRLRCGTFFDSIQARYGSSWGPVHGANYIPNICINNGVDFEYQFNSTEYITQIHGSYGAHVDSITISTNIRVLPRCGGSGGTSQKTVSGTRLMYLKGRRGCYVDGIQPVWAVE